MSETTLWRWNGKRWWVKKEDGIWYLWSGTKQQSEGERIGFPFSDLGFALTFVALGFIIGVLVV